MSYCFIIAARQNKKSFLFCHGSEIDKNYNRNISKIDQMRCVICKEHKDTANFGQDNCLDCRKTNKYYKKLEIVIAETKEELVEKIKVFEVVSNL